MSEQKLKIGITQGDPNGIGWEVILKALADPRMTELFTPVIYGSPKAAAYYRNTLRETEPVQFAPAASAAEARRGKIALVAAGEVEQPEPGRATASRRASWTPSSRDLSTRRRSRATNSATRATPNTSGPNWRANP